jgi:hypothetical protein
MRIFTNGVALRRIARKMQDLTASFAALAESMRTLAEQMARMIRDLRQPVQYGPNVVAFRRRDRLVRIATRP